MKKIILLTFLFSITFLFGQNRLEGIGVLKLGMSKEIFFQKLDSLGFKPENCNNINNTGCTPSKLHYSIISDSDISIYEVGGYKVSDIEIENLRLFFYNKELYCISISKPFTKLFKSLSIKYGPFDLDKKESTVPCTIYGETFDFPEVTYTYSYENGDIKMYSLFIYTRDLSCNKTIVQGFEIYNSKIRKIVSKIKEQEKKKIEQEEKAKELEKLKDL